MTSLSLSLFFSVTFFSNTLNPSAYKNGYMDYITDLVLVIRLIAKKLNET